MTDVATAKTPKAAIGIVADEVAQASPGVSVLAYRHYGQDCGYSPSSTTTSFDKQNIRVGQYFIWGNIHFMANIDLNTKKVSDPGAATWIGCFTRETPLPSSDILTLDTHSRAPVPDCAMEAKRTSDLGDIASYAPSEPCGCFFDFTSTGKTRCATCKVNADCAVSAPNCRYGYCEVN